MRGSQLVSRAVSRRTRATRGKTRRGELARCGKNESQLAGFFGVADQLGALALDDDVLGDDALFDARQRRDLVHHLEHDLFDDRTQAARARFAAPRLLGDRAQRILGEAELDALELEQALVLLGE